MPDLAAAAGRLVAGPLGAVAGWRRGRPIHPRGAVLDAVLERHGAEPPLGVPWLDGSGTTGAVIRFSRGAGLPAPLPDVLGLAVRLPGDDDEPVDLLLSTSGRGPLARRVPVLRSDAAATYGSIMAYRSAAGPVRLAAFPDVAPLPSDPEPVAAAAGTVQFTLAVAPGVQGWRPFATLRTTGAHGPLDTGLRFDAVRHPPPGLVADGPLARFREPAYLTARRVGS
ncbi:phosphodiesterase [Blastococcus sp. MG754427]|nr:phosphodiesterase [Blastococcus sp. MG754427]